MSNSVRPHRWQPTRLPRHWDSPGKNTGVGCHFLLQCVKVKSESEVAQLCLTLSDLMDCSLPGSSINGIFQARVLEWGAIEIDIWYWYFTVYGIQKDSLLIYLIIKEFEKKTKYFFLQFSSVQFSHSVVSDSLWPHESQHARPPCPTQTPGVHSDSSPLSHWRHPAISSSGVPFSSCPQSLPATESFPMSQLFPWGGQSTGVSASASFQARTLEWVAISFSNAWKWKVKVKSFSHVRLLATPWTAAYQASPSMGFSRQEYWSGVPLPSLFQTIKLFKILLLFSP